MTTYAYVIGVLVGVLALAPGVTAAVVELVDRHRRRRAALRRARPLRRLADG